MKHIIQYSGGLCSFFTAKRVIEKYGKDNTLLLFCDTLIEDEDLYRFIDDSVNYFGCEFIRVADGRTPFQVYKDYNFLGNSRVAHCTKILKIKQARDYLEKNFSPEECVLYLGIDWTELHRQPAIIKNWQPYKVEFPMSENPLMDKEQMKSELAKIGIEEPNLYKLGFVHNNCGGFCCKAGQGHWKRVLETMPNKFAYYEEQEQDIIKHIGKNVAMMKKTVNGETFPYTLKQLREDYEKDISNIDLFDIGGCGCTQRNGNNICHK